jgi:hypothetical protein
MFDQLERLGPGADLLRDPIQLVIKDVAKPLRKDQRKNELLVLRRIFRTADRAGRILDPRFERFVVGPVRCHGPPVVKRAGL